MRYFTVNQGRVLQDLGYQRRLLHNFDVGALSASLVLAQAIRRKVNFNVHVLIKDVEIFFFSLNLQESRLGCF